MAPMQPLSGGMRCHGHHENREQLGVVQRVAFGGVQDRQQACSLNWFFLPPGSVDIVGGLCASGEAQDIST